MRDLNPFRYSLAELSKALIALIAFLGYGATLFVVVEPGLIEAIQGLVVPGIGVVAVFAVGNHTASEYNKAILALITAGITVANYFAKVTPSTENKLIVAAGALATVIAVLFKGGAPVVALATKTSHRTQHRV